MAAQFLDLLWPIFLLLGWERVAIDPGNTAVTPLDFVRYPLSHSFLAALGWASLFSAAYIWLTKNKSGALWLWALVLSHWLLDAVTHRPDLPWYPGSRTLVGLGLWNSRPATLVVETMIFFWGATVYHRTTIPKDRAGMIGFSTLIWFLFFVYLSNLFGPPPPDAHTVAILGLSQWMLILGCRWIDRHRSTVSAGDEILG